MPPSSAFHPLAAHPAAPCCSVLPLRCRPCSSRRMSLLTMVKAHPSVRTGVGKGRGPVAGGRRGVFGLPTNEKRGCKRVKTRESALFVQFAAASGWPPPQGTGQGRRRWAAAGCSSGRARGASATQGATAAEPDGAQGILCMKGVAQNCHVWHVKESKRLVARGDASGRRPPPGGGQPAAPLGNGI